MQGRAAAGGPCGPQARVIAAANIGSAVIDWSGAWLWRGLAGDKQSLRRKTMSISDQIDALQKRAADLKSSFEQSKKETNAQVKERLGKAKADIEARQDDVKEKADQATGHAKGQWAAMKADAAARMTAFQAKIDRQRDEHDAKVAERDAEDAEADAADALDYAAYVVDQAQLAVLDAVDARTWANAQAVRS
jgi:hypothetical protein